MLKLSKSETLGRLWLWNGRFNLASLVQRLVCHLFSVSISHASAMQLQQYSSMTSGTLTSDVSNMMNYPMLVYQFQVDNAANHNLIKTRGQPRPRLWMTMDGQRHSEFERCKHSLHRTQSRLKSIRMDKMHPPPFHLLHMLKRSVHLEYTERQQKRAPINWSSIEHASGICIMYP